jgi:hypothetical protein
MHAMCRHEAPWRAYFRGRVSQGGWMGRGGGGGIDKGAEPGEARSGSLAYGGNIRRGQGRWRGVVGRHEAEGGGNRTLGERGGWESAERHVWDGPRFKRPSVPLKRYLRGQGAGAQRREGGGGVGRRVTRCTLATMRPCPEPPAPTHTCCLSSPAQSAGGACAAGWWAHWGWTGACPAVGTRAGPLPHRPQACLRSRHRHAHPLHPRRRARTARETT